MARLKSMCTLTNYKLYALLQDVKRLRTGDLEYGEESFPASYRTDNFYGEGADGFEEMENEDDVEQLISDKSAAIRDPELTQHSSNLGIIQMSGLVITMVFFFWRLRLWRSINKYIIIIIIIIIILP